MNFTFKITYKTNQTLMLKSVVKLSLFSLFCFTVCYNFNFKRNQLIRLAKNLFSLAIIYPMSWSLGRRFIKTKIDLQSNNAKRNTLEPASYFSLNTEKHTHFRENRDYRMPHICLQTQKDILHFGLHVSSFSSCNKQPAQTQC